ncbi:hypothetical protein Tco_0127683 [Tanacetum coccineum]
MVISSPCLIDNKELTSPEQTAPGKDFSNLLIVDSLLKTIWSSMHHVFTMKHWLVQSKRLLGQEARVSNQDWQNKEEISWIVHSDDEDIQDDSSKQGRKLSDAEVQEKASTETEPFIQEVTPTKVIQDQGSSEKGSAEISIAGATKGTTSEVPVVSTAGEDISTAGRMTSYNEEIARQWDEEERQRVMAEAKSTKKIDWNDPSVIRYHALKMKPKTVAQARKNMIKYLKNQGNYKISDFKVKRKKSLPRKRRFIKRQKLEEDDEKEELKEFLDIIPREEFAEDVESLSTKYPIVDWKTYTLTENFILVKERYSASRPEGYDLMLWGDLHTLFEPDEEDEIWKNQHEYNCSKVEVFERTSSAKEED